MSLVDFRKILPSFWTIQLIGWTLYFVVIYITFLSIAQPENFVSLLFLKGFRALTGFFLTSIFLRSIYKRFASRFSIFGLVLLVLVCAVFLAVAWTAIELGYFNLTNPNFDTTKYLPRTPRVALDYAMTLAAWSAFYLGVKNWWSWQNERENALQSSALANKAQLEMLRYQLNPHFLFNALNSVRASIDEDSVRAKGMITQLSEFLRYSLLNESSKKIPLRAEIEAVKNYLAIEKIRFEDKLIVNFEIENDAENFNVPCFLLNPLVENAVKHGLQTSPKPLNINIYAKTFGGKLILEVSNSGKLINNENGTKIGLKNVRERLEKLYGENGKFELRQDDNFVKARIEIIDEVQNSNH
jgi:two-component system LytT family sensor kinase